MIKDEEFIRGEVPMTKEEIRVITLSKARIAENSTIWDVGAGTGSISVEAALLAPAGRVFAIEKNPDGTALIKKNSEKFSAKNITIIEGEAPDALENLPAPDAVIIGGSGRQTEKILDISLSTLKSGGRIVLNCITIQTLSAALSYFRNRKIRYDAIEVQVNRLSQAGSYDMMKALNPIFIITAVK